MLPYAGDGRTNGIPFAQKYLPSVTNTDLGTIVGTGEKQALLFVKSAFFPVL